MNTRQSWINNTTLQKESGLFNSYKLTQTKNYIEYTFKVTHIFKNYLTISTTNLHTIFTKGELQLSMKSDKQVIVRLANKIR